jgi:hypothetical protein
MGADPLSPDRCHGRLGLLDLASPGEGRDASASGLPDMRALQLRFAREEAAN